MNSKTIIVQTDRYCYPKQAPFRPDEAYPENPFPLAGVYAENHIYAMVREGFVLAQYDHEHTGTEEWNPLGGLIHPGNTVLIKPNLVMDYNPSGGGTDCLYTQAAVVAAVCDYVIIALKKQGRIIIGDAPMQECDFPKLTRESGYEALVSFLNESLPETIHVELADLRGVRSTNKSGIYEYYETDTKSVTIDLGDESEFSGMTGEKLRKMRITNYDPEILQRHHNETRHEYCISASALEADVIINMPKPKTHRKAGATSALKNLVGINARKEYLPHHTNGSIAGGGDEYYYRSLIKSVKNFALDKKNHYNQGKGSRAQAVPYQFLNKTTDVLLRFINRDHCYEGNWYGNDTISRTIVDLNKILFFADKKGQLQAEQQRRSLIVADMVISGEGEGPVSPTPKKVGWIAMGESPVAFDEMIMTLMGAKTEMIPTLRRAKNQHGKYAIPAFEGELAIVSNGALNGKKLDELTAEMLLHFEPTSGWRKAYR